MSSDFTPPPSLPDESVSPPAGPASPLTTSTGMAPNVAAGLAVLFSLIGGIVFLIIEKKSRFVRFWAMQSVVLSFAWFALAVLTFIIDLLFRGPLHFVASIWGLVYGIALPVLYLVALFQAFTGKEWEMPFLGKIARQQLPPAPTDLP